MKFSCFYCNKSFTQKRSLVRHTKEQHDGIFDCPNCNRPFTRYDNFILHWKACNHNQSLHEQNEPSNSRKRTRSSSGGEERPSKRKFVQNDSALDDTFKNYSVEQGADDIFIALNKGILALKPAIFTRFDAKTHNQNTCLTKIKFSFIYRH